MSETLAKMHKPTGQHFNTMLEKDRNVQHLLTQYTTQVDYARRL